MPAALDRIRGPVTLSCAPDRRAPI